MKLLRTLAALAACCVLSGCFVTSLNPLFESADYLFDKSLLGTWITDGDNPQTLAVIQAGENAYRITHSDKGSAEVYEGRLGEIGGVRYLDIFPVSEGVRESPHYIPVHSFWRVRVSGDNLYLTQMNFDWLRQFLDSSQYSLAHQDSGDTLVLTAPSAELRDFLRIHADDLFQKDYQGVWKRQ